MRRFGFLLGLIGLLFMFMIPQVTQAATSTTACACFCGTSADGARLLGTKDSNSACAAACVPSSSFSAPDLQYIGCYTSEAQYPAKSDLCWTQDQCVLDNAENTWDDAVPNCSDDQPGSIHMGYCYKVPPKVNVMTVIGGKTQFNTIADYISAVYQMLIPFMSVVAVVMIMIGGLQYTLARGNPKAITQAKERITKAVIGFVLLMVAFVMANLLDPSLTHLKQLRIPMVKKVVLLDNNSTCEYLSSVGFQIDNLDTAAFKSKSCGTAGSITSIKDVRDNVSIGSWKVGDPCQYSQCSGGGACASTEAYVANSDGVGGTTFGGSTTEQTVYSCQSCDSVIGDAASAASCAAHEAPDESSEVGIGKKYYCEYISGSGQPLDAAGTVATTAACIDLGGSPGSGYIDCTTIRSQATSGGSCRSYDSIQFTYTVDGLLGGTIGTGGSLKNGYGNADMVGIFTDLCTSDPCGLVPKGTTPGCQAITSSTSLDCVSKQDNVTTSTSASVSSAFSESHTSNTNITGTCYGRIAGSQVNCENGEAIATPEEGIYSE